MSQAAAFAARSGHSVFGSNNGPDSEFILRRGINGRLLICQYACLYSHAGIGTPIRSCVHSLWWMCAAAGRQGTEPVAVYILADVKM